MALTVKSKILLTVLSVVLMFTFFILFYFPARQEQVLLENYNEEIENFANSVALGVKIALTEQNFEGVETAIDFVRDDKRLQFVSLIQSDTVWNSAENTYSVDKTVFKTFPEGATVDIDARSNEEFIYKTAAFSTPIMNGEVMLSFSTREIVASMEQIRLTSILASLIVFGIGLGIGYMLAKNISGPVLALRDAAQKVGEGDLSQSVENRSTDEIGELAVAFNKMVRELNIEAALEKIRNRTIAMQDSSEWKEVVAVFFTQMKHLGFQMPACRLIFHDENTEGLYYWISGSHHDRVEEYFDDYKTSGFQEIFSKAKSDNSIYAVHKLSAEDTTPHVEELVNQIDGIILSGSSDSFDLKELVVCTAFTSYGAVETVSKNVLSASDEILLHRLAKVIDQSYTRFLDLKKSEAQALETVKQASLDRVRGEVASMRSKDDLNKITPLVWRELTTLKVPFIRCGVFIIDEEDESILSILSAPDGKALGLFSLKIDDTKITSNIFNSWKHEQVYTEHWDEEAFTEWTKRLIELGHIESRNTYQGASVPPKSLHLHFIPFRQGMLYVGNVEPLSEDNVDVVKSLAEVFSIAFARYEDFTKLEVAKNEVEQTLSELKSTQSQLVHSEKMASLGELTAGIAHEIQNPLNFVNNFSELSYDLIDEMNKEIENNNDDEVLAIAHDLKQNLEKINHHGNRASSIVKGMLEHSRAGTAKKEFGDINEIAEEYLRLAYHGFRAKDKFFNVNFELDLDKSLPKVSIFSQDISRVLLNLINNAFYAVSEKSKRKPEGYQPTVKVSTKQVNNSVQIRVKDNGDGIPGNVVDKIFQPFFTTKPTGKGTGLGLSISYDIVTKGHNGNLEVVTHTEGNGQAEPGTEFVVTLPF